MSGRRELNGGTYGTKHKIPPVNRVQSERDAKPLRRPGGAARRAESLGGLESLLSKIQAEYEEVQERDKEAQKRAPVEQVTVQQKERWKRTREVRIYFFHLH